jgi:ribosome-associated translation inhibitor RaiA
MRLHFEGKDTPLVPHLLGRMAERLAHLNTPHDDICEARVTLVQREDWHEARVRLLLAEQTLHAMQHGASPDAAIGAALRKIEDALHKVRAARYRRRTILRHATSTKFTPLPAAARRQHRAL